VARLEAETREWQPTGVRMTWLAMATTLVVVPHMLRVPPWLSVGFVALAGWALLAALGKTSAPGRNVRFAFTIGGPLAVLATFGTLLGRDAGVALLIILAACKLIETRTLRDAYVTVSVACFLGVTNLLYSQSIFAGTYMLVVVIAIVGAILVANDRTGQMTTRQRVRTTAALIAQAAPVMLVLFVLFPRLPGPLWGLPKDAHAGISKLSDSMSPGNISNLSLSDVVAFRVRFLSATPLPKDMYWRGPVLWKTDGWEWNKLPMGTLAEVPAQFNGAPVDYEVTLEPHFEHWLFALDVPAHIPAQATLSADYQLHSHRPIRKLHKYSLRSFTDYTMPMLDPAERDFALQLPEGFHPKTRALAQRWRDEADQHASGSGPPTRPKTEGGTAPRAIVQRALNHFRAEPFFYTLRPPLLEGDTIDEFLFDTRRGFCEFYAASFTVLMRAAGIPARVVTGYQGGEFNDIGQYLIVRQRDAHAWAEVWLEGEGWVRVDPTAAVAPERIEFGMDAAMPAPLGPSALGIHPSGEIERALRTLRHGWDALNNTWNQWVIDYSDQRQRRFLDRLGIDIHDWRSVASAFLICAAVLLGLGAWWMTPRPTIRDRTARVYARFCAKLARRGLQRSAHEGPLDFCQRVLETRPDLAHDMDAITALYVSLRYGPEHDSEALVAFCGAVKRFSP
jgi:transglutaminase-like putative cysteine protease